MKKILVTGFAGFIGSNLVKQLRRDYQVVAVDNFTDFSNSAIKQARAQNLGYNPQATGDEHGVTFLNADICDAGSLRKIFEAHQFDVIIHLAALTGVRQSLENPQAYIEVNVSGFLNVLECAKVYSVKNVIYASSSSVYGLNDEVPYTETQKTDSPISVYAASKKANELLAHTYAHLFGINLTGLRFFTVYGEWTRPDMAAYIFMKAIYDESPIKLFNEGRMIRDFTHVDDVVRVIQLLITKLEEERKIGHRIFNVGNHSPIFTAQFLSAIENAMDKKAVIENEPAQPGDMAATNASAHAIYDYIGFKPDTKIEKGVQKMVDWFLSYYPPRS
ncbi:MAG: NAD-dependent epimerase/dehydratase family protein [Bacteroidetes bacterium]|nr:NAD-dependent epimerase/dehydratase family protein [Bacteroidota bacterium]MBK8659531.1 NAD-dependent epimerase/dehydratase family protein [Bacteroidota bacterium]